MVKQSLVRLSGCTFHKIIFSAKISKAWRTVWKICTGKFYWLFPYFQSQLSKQELLRQYLDYLLVKLYIITKSHVLCIVYLWVYYNRIIEDPSSGSGEDTDSGDGELSKSNKRFFFQKFHLVQFFSKNVHA